MRCLARAFHRTTGVPLPDGINPGGMTDPLIIREAFRLAGVAGNRWAAFEEQVWLHYPGELELEMARADAARKVYPGVVELLDALERDPRFSLALLTGNLEITARIKLEPFGLNRYFPVGAFGSDCADRCRLGLVALERARRHYGRDFNPESTWVIGDTPRDIDAARAMGARALAVATGFHPRAELEEHLPDQILDDFADLDAVLEILGS